MKAVVAVHGRYHGFDLATQLHRRGMLSRLLTTYPAAMARRRLPGGIPLGTAPALELLRRAHAALHLPGRTDLIVARAFARFTATHLPPDADLLVGWSSATLEAIPAARERGMAVVLERGSLHMAAQTEVLHAAHARWGLAWHATDPRMIARELAEYEQADLIVTGSRAARDSFLAHGVAAERVAINHYGVDLAAFRPGDDGGAAPPRLLFVGQVGIRKGVPWLLEAFARMPPPWQLHLVGPVEPDMAALFGRLPMERVVVRGPLPATALPAEYRCAAAFCLPSVEEGFGMVILQAMASGLPVVASTATGGPDAGRDGEEVVLVPPADSTALADALNRLAEDPALRRRLGAAARRRVADGFGWDDYGERAAALLSGVAARRP